MELCDAQLAHFENGFKFKIGNGETSLWYNSWVEKEPLCNRVLYVHYHDLHFRIKDIVDANSWSLGSLYTILDSDTKQKISLLKPLLVGDMPDVWVWESVISGTYTTKDAYKWLLDPSRLHLQHIGWSWIWRLKVPSNVHFFLWELCHDSIPVRVVLKRRSMIVSDVCPICLIS